MARKHIINPVDLQAETRCRIQLTGWEKYQEELIEEKKRWYVKLMVHNAMDSINRGTPNERLVWWELLRLSGAGRRKGWVVIGDNEPITPLDISHALQLDIKIVLDGLKHNMAQRRITCNEV
jgi:hypothetical protein